MSWKDILKQDKVEKFFRRKKQQEAKPSLNEAANIDNLKTHFQEIHEAFKNDPNFLESNKFAIKVTPENFSGRGRKRGLVWDMQESLFGNIDFVSQYAGPSFERLGYKVERLGDMLQVTKVN
tara:strand:+ start:2307 stop:2672 length:366 start_codon:yes stop_codon:yes gene_type:complete